MFRTQEEARDYLQAFNDLPGSDIAGVIMFDALTNILPYIENSGALTKAQKKVMLRQIAKQAEKVADRYNLDHYTDLGKYIQAA